MHVPQQQMNANGQSHSADMYYCEDTSSKDEKLLFLLAMSQINILNLNEIYLMQSAVWALNEAEKID